MPPLPAPPSELILSAFAEAGVAMVVTDAELERPGPRILAINAAFTELTGYSELDALGKTPRILQGPLSDRVVLDRLKRELAAGRRFHGETVNYRKDGAAFVIEWNVSPLRDACGVVTHFVAVQRDVTAQRLATRRIQEGAEFLRRLLDGLPDHAVVALDPDGRITSWNIRAADLEGYAEDELRGRHFSVFYPEEDRAAGLPEAHLAEARGKSFIETEGWRVRRDGSRFWAQASLSALRDADGHVSAYVKILRDRTGHRRAQEERERMQAELHQLHRLDSLGLVAGGVAHDFNNLLAGILAHAEVWMICPDTAASAIDNIRATCARARALNDRLLTFARRNVRHAVRLDLAELTSDVVRLLRPTFGGDLALVYERPRAPVPAQGDATEWFQIVLNLCVNARDAMEGRRGAVTVRLGAAGCLPENLRPAHLPSDAHWVLEVGDEGPGIPAAALPRIFDPFFTTKDPGKGSGLGLSIVHGVARNWGGTVTAENAPGCGAIFRVFVPAANAALPSPPDEL